MKLLVLLTATCFALSAASEDAQITSENVEEALREIFKDFKVEIPPEFLEKLTEYDMKGIRNYDEQISAIVDEFVDKIFDNMRNVLANSSSNSIALPNISLKLNNNAKLELTNGLLQDIASITRDADVVVDYNTGESNIITLTLPLRFDDIKYSFDYHTKVLLVSFKGGLHGTIKNVKIDAVLSYNFNTHQASLDHYDMKHTGQITIKFTGNKLVDWLIDAISAVVTTTLHPLIVDILQKAINGVISGVVDSINEAISGFLNPTTTILTTVPAFF